QSALRDGLRLLAAPGRRRRQAGPRAGSPRRLARLPGDEDALPAAPMPARGDRGVPRQRRPGAAQPLSRLLAGARDRSRPRLGARPVAPPCPAPQGRLVASSLGPRTEALAARPRGRPLPAELGKAPGLAGLDMS